MDFLFERDWLGREQSFLYAPEYIVFFALVTVIAVMLPIFLRGVSDKKVRTVMICMWVFALVMDVFRWSIGWIDTAITGSEFSVGSALPLHTCSTFMYTVPLALFAKNEKIKTAVCNYLCTINLFGGIVGMYVATAMMSYYSMASFYGAEHMIYHAIVIVLPLIMLVTGFYKPQKGDMWLGLIVFAIIATPTFIFDSIFAVDYMYIYDGSTLEPFKALAAIIPHRLVWTLVAVAGYVGITAIFQFSAIGIRTLYNKSKKAEPAAESKSEIPELNTVS